MLDLALLGFLTVFVILGFRRPYVWILAYIYVDILVPGKVGFSIMPAIQSSLLVFCLAVVGWFLADSKKEIRFTWRQGWLLLFFLYCWWTTSYADFPEPAANKWNWVWKALLFTMILPLTLRTKLRIESAILTAILTLGAIVIGAGIKTVLGGGGYGRRLLLVNDNSGLYESSTLGTVAICSIPLIVWLSKHGTIFKPDWRVKLFSAGLIFSCLLIPIGTEARTGLVCMAALLLLMLREIKQRLSFIIAGAVLVFVAVPFIPQSYYERMATLGEVGGDESASTRLAVWEWTLDYVKANPTGGGFDAYRSNQFTYDIPITESLGNTTAVEYREVTDQGRAYHSAIFEVLGEQGWPGLFLWLLIHAAGLWQMETIRRKWHKRQGDGEQWQAPLASALMNAQIVYLVGALFQGIAYQPFILMLIAIQIGFHTWISRSSPQPNPGAQIGQGGNLARTAEVSGKGLP